MSCYFSFQFQGAGSWATRCALYILVVSRKHPWIIRQITTRATEQPTVLADKRMKLPAPSSTANVVEFPAQVAVSGVQFNRSP